MGDRLYRATAGALGFDAYYKDEFGVINDASNTVPDQSARQGFHKNKFTRVFTINGTLSESFSTLIEDNVPNKANPTFNIGLKDRSNQAPADRQDVHSIQIYFSDSVIGYWQGLKGQPWTQPINFTLYFGVGTELNRHGIRSFFESRSNYQAIIQVPGIEPPKGSPRFGVAIDDSQIKAILSKFFGIADIPYQIKVLAGFSTGSAGLNQTLLNDLIDLTKVERLIFYDCLYSLQSGSTADAIKNLKSRAGGKLKIIIYKASECGNSWKKKTSTNPNPFICPSDKMDPGMEYDFNNLAVVANNPGLIDANGIINNLFQNPSYIALVIFRALQAAVSDNVISLSSSNSQQYTDMEGLLQNMNRGMTISNKNCFRYVHGSLPGSGNYTYFEDWSVDPANDKIIKAFARKVGSTKDKDSFRNLLWGNSIPGWPGGDGEDKHDLLIPEFGWEYLPY